MVIFKKIFDLRLLFTKEKLRSTAIVLKDLGSFFCLLTIFLIAKGFIEMTKLRFFPKTHGDKIIEKMGSLRTWSESHFNGNRQGTISRINLIELAFANMKAKRTRTIVTIGGMTMGIGAIVFLVSIGYGLQDLVTTRIARLDELKQADVTAQSGSKVNINDKSISGFKGLVNVDKVLPLIAVVGHINFKDSSSDVAVYGVTSEYLQQSAIKPTRGAIFKSNNLSLVVDNNNSGEVAGVATVANIVAEGEKISDVYFSIKPGEWLKVRAAPTTAAKIIGYTRRVEGQQSGEEIWGATYLSDDNAGKSAKTETGKWLGRWIRSKVLLWEKKVCKTNEPDCDDGQYKVMRDDSGTQIQMEGAIAEINLSIPLSQPADKVLGLATESGSLSTVNDNADFIEIASESAALKPVEIKTVSLGSKSVREAVVNQATLKIMGIKEAEAIGKKFTTSFVVTGDLLDQGSQGIQSAPAEYTIVGVIPGDKTPLFYVPFIDLRSLGIANYSQVKVVAKDTAALPKIRKQVEAMGYASRSVIDTVNQVNSLFATARTILALLGMVALGVAALGMFNTLTISLLERTREVGLMKAMGMRSNEVRELFLTESMMMGFFGGLAGLLFGFLAGKFLSFLISIFTVVRGVGWVDISTIPIGFVLVIVFLALSVGVVTGIYPARRATKISALDALRYE